jgi:formate transporter
MTISLAQVQRPNTLAPASMANKAEEAGIRKSRMGLANTIVLSMLAGFFIGLGGLFATTVGTGAAAMPFGVARLLSGLVFSLGLVLVVVGGAELFTGNTLLVMAWAEGKVPARAVLRNWVIVFAGNFVGAVLTAALVFASGQYAFGGGAVGATALATASAKLNLGFGQAIALGALCNALVCLAIWLTYSARSTTDRILSIVPPVTAFVAAGFEHSIANMYFVPLALFIRNHAAAAFWTSINKTPADFASITWSRFLMGNLLPVTIGNILGGAVIVGAVFWYVYLRKAHVVPPAPVELIEPPSPSVSSLPKW